MFVMMTVLPLESLTDAASDPVQSKYFGAKVNDTAPEIVDAEAENDSPV